MGKSKVKSQKSKVLVGAALVVGCANGGAGIGSVPAGAALVGACGCSWGRRGWWGARVGGDVGGGGAGWGMRVLVGAALVVGCALGC